MGDTTYNSDPDAFSDELDAEILRDRRRSQQQQKRAMLELSGKTHMAHRVSDRPGKRAGKRTRTGRESS